MMNDENYYVRREVAKRIGIEHLPKMMNDEESGVRYEVAKRIDPKFLGEMFGFDFDPEYQKGLIKVLAEREDLRRV
jgi:HEAT repeat protein